MKKERIHKGARHFARSFYNSKAWRTKRKAYRQKHPLCERCLKRGLYVPAQCVHHKVHISEQNYYDHAILLGDENLESLCNECHEKEHNGSEVIYTFDETGSLICDYDRKGE